MTFFSNTVTPNPALNLVRFALWTLRDKAAQRRLALRWASGTSLLTIAQGENCG